MIAKKIQKSKNFTIVDNEYLNDSNLSFKAKGILTYFLSLPGDWVIYFDEVITHASDGIKSFRSGVDELIKEGYIKRYPIRENGVIVRWETEVFEKKHGLGCQNVHEANKDLAKLDQANDSLLRTKKPSTDDSKYLNNFNGFMPIIDAWNDISPRPISLDDILTSFKLTYDLNTLITDYDEADIIRVIRSMKSNPKKADFAWFVTRNNFESIFNALSKV